MTYRSRMSRIGPHFRPVWALVLVVSFAFCEAIVPPSTAQENDTEKTIQICSPAVAQLTIWVNGKPRYGTGFLIDETTLITNHHVVQEAGSIKALFSGPNGDVECGILDSRPDVDLAALKIRNPRQGALGRDAAVPAVGTGIVAIGSPFGITKLAHDGIVSGNVTFKQLAEKVEFPAEVRFDDGQSFLVHNAPTDEGMSGAPIIDRKTARVIGVQSFEILKNNQGGSRFSIPVSEVDKLELQGKEPIWLTAGPTLQSFKSEGGAVDLAYTSSTNSAPVLTFTGTGGTERQLDVSSKHFGVVSREPEKVFERYVKDKARFSRIITKDRLGEILSRHKVVQVVNPYYRVSFLVPSCFAISEAMVDAGNGRRDLVVTLTYKDGNAPPSPFNTITLRFRRDGFTEKERQLRNGGLVQLQNNITMLTDSYARKIMRLNVQPNPLPFKSQSEPTDVIPFTAGSEPFPRIDSTNLRARYQVMYVSQTKFNLAYLVYSAIEYDTIANIAFTYRFQPQVHGILDADFLERMFIAESVAFGWSDSPDLEKARDLKYLEVK